MVRLTNVTIALLLPAACLVAQPEKTAWDVLKPGLVDTNPLNRRQAVTATGSIGLDPEAIRRWRSGRSRKIPIR